MGCYVPIRVWNNLFENAVKFMFKSTMNLFIVELCMLTSALEHFCCLNINCGLFAYCTANIFIVWHDTLKTGHITNKQLLKNSKELLTAFPF